MKETSSFLDASMFNGLPGLYLCGDFTIRGGWQLGPRKNREYEIVYFPAGSKSVYTAGSVKYPLDEPCFILTRPGETHDYDFDSGKPIRHIFCHFVLPEGSRLDGLPAYIRAEGIAYVPALLKYVVYLASVMTANYRERISSLLLTILGELGAAAAAEQVAKEIPAKTVPMVITKAMAYMDEHLHEPLVIRELAELAGWSHEYFTRRFVQYQGQSPKQYLLQRRIDQACEMLCSDNLSIKEIAYKVGFQSEQYFSRAFIKVVGISATKYKERHADPRLLSLHLAPTGDINAPYPLNRMFGDLQEPSQKK
ncbi:AraC family transcriptional regulator [Paenibacillus nasutitermitis]|uniref:HTH araC/xylS-type domain-containing protein n=1 Tax=Paenibacillus nasutitermitis TaxID=1652958 RepID=A0A916ZH50_9BACL|nr:AraC family transcriptional regulator [Paenibacillus nasutitermitis]GGD97190.1 hypothetical protein GCM10010911_64920 [Paenibacillus nasutitermitis]